MTLPAGLRKLALTAHVTFSVGWLGAVAGFLALAVAALISNDAQLVRAAYLSMELTARFAIVPLCLASLLSGLVQSLGTTWGLFRHYWVLFKLLINVFATIILLMYMSTLRYFADAVADVTVSNSEILGLRSASPAIHAGAALFLLLVATTLAVYKPRGMTPYGRRRSLVAIATLATLYGCATVSTPAAADAIAIVGVTVIDPSSSEPSTPDQTILISDGVIRAVGPPSAIDIPAGARRVDGRGKFAIPGLWDAHVHFMNTGVTALPLFVANGVTSVREMGGYIDSTRAWQARMNAGTLVGPRIFTPGPILESPRYLQGVVERSALAKSQLALRVLPYRIGVGDSIEARRAIDSLVKLHVDFVKVRTSANPTAFYAILREARRAGLRVAAHLQNLPLRSALDSGQTDLEHAILPAMSRLPAATRDSIYRKFVDNGAWYTPTLTVSRAVMLSGDSAARAIFSPDAIRLDQRRAYASPWLLGWWRMQVDERATDTSSTRAAEGDEAYASSTNDVHRMHELGVNILAGTDAGSVLVYPGFGLHEELQRLVEDAGLAPRDALWSATVGPARFARLDDRLGTLSRGKIADIVLLDADPLTNIRNTRRIFAVVQGGRLFMRADLDALLAKVRAEVAR